MKFPYISVPAITPEMSGFYRISHEAYHAGPGISSTRVKKALQSYAAYSHLFDEDSEALAFGRAFHMAMLEPDLYSMQYRTTPLASRRSKAWDDFAAFQKTAGRQPLLESEDVTISEMITCIRGHPEYAKLPGFDAEIMGITQCAETGLQIKCKADLFGAGIVDFKSTSGGVTASDFMGDIVRWRYHVSAAFYQDIIAQLTGERLPFIVIPVTKKAPFECEFYRLSDALLEEGRKLYKAGLRRIKGWLSLSPERLATVDKHMRVLHPTARVLYGTTETLTYIEGT